VMVSGTGLAIVLLAFWFRWCRRAIRRTSWGFELKLVGGTAAAIVLGLTLYWRGAREKSRGAAAAGG